jgi:hypothetical protein
MIDYKSTNEYKQFEKEIDETKLAIKSIEKAIIYPLREKINNINDKINLETFKLLNGKCFKYFIKIDNDNKKEYSWNDYYIYVKINSSDGMFFNCLTFQKINGVDVKISVEQYCYESIKRYTEINDEEFFNEYKKVVKEINILAEKKMVIINENK